MDISSWLKYATKRLKDIGIESSRLDAELILASTLRKNRPYLHAHLDESIDPRRIDIANARLQLRAERVPIAYILGEKEFYGRTFNVTPNVLIPRPESEDIIDLFLEASADDISDNSTVIDVGTGSGCLGITAKLERSNISVILSDVSRAALEVARRNAHELEANVKIQQQDLLKGQIEPINYIIANLPYVDASWPTSPELKHEPQSALFAEDNGLSLISGLIDQAPRCLLPGGWLILEADPEQHQKIINLAKTQGFIHQKTKGYGLLFSLVGTES